jgi:hypothetical protein
VGFSPLSMRSIVRECSLSALVTCDIL